MEGLQKGLFKSPIRCVAWHSFGSFVAFNGLLKSLVAEATAGMVKLAATVPFDAGVVAVIMAAAAVPVVSVAVAVVTAGAVAARIVDTADGATRVTPEAAAIASETATAPEVFQSALIASKGYQGKGCPLK